MIRKHPENELDASCICVGIPRSSAYGSPASSSCLFVVLPSLSPKQDSTSREILDSTPTIQHSMSSLPLQQVPQPTEMLLPGYPTLILGPCVPLQLVFCYGGRSASPSVAALDVWIALELSTDQAACGTAESCNFNQAYQCWPSPLSFSFPAYLKLAGGKHLAKYRRQIDEPPVIWNACPRCPISTHRAFCSPKDP